MTDPILVTGSPRSGTTWIGKMINLADKIGYIHEVYNVMIHKNLPGETKPNQFCLITEENEADLSELYDKILTLNYSFSDQFSANKSISNFVNSVLTHFRFRSYRNSSKNPLIKDPFAIFSADWLVKNYSMQPVIVIRHPGPIFDSFKRLGWTIDFRRLYEKMPSGNAKQILEKSNLKSNSQDPSEKAIATLWSVIHAQILDYQNKFPDWLFLRYEDIFLNIESYFRKIFDYLSLDLSDDQLAKIYFYTSRGYFPKEKSDIDTRIERQDLLNGWRSRLDHENVAKLKQHIDKEVYSEFYSKRNWDSDIKF